MDCKQTDRHYPFSTVLEYFTIINSEVIILTALKAMHSVQILIPLVLSFAETDQYGDGTGQLHLEEDSGQNLADKSCN